MIRKEEFNKRRTPDVYTRRNGRLEKLNEKKPYDELVERMDDVIDRLDTIIEGMENFISGIDTEISFDIDDLLLPEKMREHIKRVNKEQSGDTEEDDEDRPDIDSVIGTLEMLKNRDSDSIIDPYNKIDIRERYIKIEELLNETWFGKTTQESDDTSDDNTESEDEYDDSNEIPSCNIILKDDIIKKIKERTEEFTKKKIPSNIIDNLETNDHIVRFTSVMGDFLNGLIDNTDFETNIEYIKLKIYYSMLVMLQHYASKIDYKTLSRLYNTLNRIFDVINSIITNELKLSILIDYTLWITFVVHCLSDGLLDIPAEMRFSTDNKNKLITIYVSKNDIIKDVYKIINDYSPYHKSIRFGIERKSLFDGYTVLNPSEFKLKKTIFCILGESGSGKDTLVNYLINDFKLPLKSVLSYTDRPIRPGEQQGKEHIFLSKDKMTALLDSYKKDIAAYTKIGETGYRYCATTTTINKSDIYIIDPNGLKDLKERTSDRYNIVAIYIDCPLEERRKRTQKRGDEAIRFESRVNAESEQFAEFREEHGYDYIIDNGPISTIYKSSMALLDIFRYYKKDIIKK